MLSPEGPTGGAIRQAIFDDESNGGFDDASGIVTARVGQVGHVGVEVLVAGDAVMLRVDQEDIARSPCERVAQVVECATREAIAVGTVSAMRTRAPAVITALARELGFGQVADAGGALGGIGTIFARPWHDESPGRAVLPGITLARDVLFTKLTR